MMDETKMGEIKVGHSDMVDFAFGLKRGQVIQIGSTAPRQRSMSRIIAHEVWV